MVCFSNRALMSSSGIRPFESLPFDVTADFRQAGIHKCVVNTVCCEPISHSCKCVSHHPSGHDRQLVGDFWVSC